MNRSESTYGSSKSCLKCYFWKGKRLGDAGKVVCDANECGLCEIDKKSHINDDLCGDYILYRDISAVQKYKQRLREYEKANKNRNTGSNRSKSHHSTKTGKKSSSTAGGGFLLLIIIAFLFSKCGKNTTQEQQQAKQNEQTQQVEVQLNQQANGLDIRTTEEFIFADSDQRYLSDEEVKSLNKDEIRIAINEIYARRGRAFSTPELKEYFLSKSWYNPQYSQAEFSEKVFNEYERANINLLSKYR